MKRYNFKPVVLWESVSVSNFEFIYYTDLKGPLLAYDQGRIIDAQGQWKSNLLTSCGDHLVAFNARLIHRFVNDHIDPGYLMNWGSHVTTSFAGR